LLVGLHAAGHIAADDKRTALLRLESEADYPLHQIAGAEVAAVAGGEVAEILAKMIH
jgi:hypothetical protein